MALPPEPVAGASPAAGLAVSGDDAVTVVAIAGPEADMDRDADLPAGLGRRLAFDPEWCIVVDGEGGPGALPGASPGLSDGEPRPGLGTAGPERALVAESLLTVADGLVGTRGVLEEDAGDGAVVAAGLYQPAAGVQDRLLPMVSWCAVPGIAADGPGRRVLDLRDGVLTRQATVAGQNSPQTLRTARFACADRPGTGVLAATLPAADQPAEPDDEVWAASSPYGGGAVRATRTSQVGSDRRSMLRVACHAVDPDHRPDLARAEAALASATAAGGRVLLAEQRRAWRRRWAVADVTVQGDPNLTLAVRFAVFHVLSSVAHGRESAVGARGLTGPAYAGHVFWDTEAFVLPLLAAVDGDAAAAVLAYRRRRLPSARRAAAALGCSGARFPWESARDGSDVTPRSGIDQHGTVVPIHTGAREEHITADVAWAAWHHAAWQGGWSYLEGPGRPLLVDTARYWASRVSWDAAGRAHIDRVIGPDEYHDPVDDNAFTNLMARANLRRAADLVERCGPGTEAGEDTRAEAAQWRRVADAIVDGLDPATGCYEQFAGYDRLEPLPVAALGSPPLSADLVLGAERLAATTIVKQADVLMAHLLVPEETAPGSLAANMDRYLPFTAHGSSLSPAVHATLLARLGRTDEALALLDIATAIDLQDLTQTTGGGLHLANLAGIWRVLVDGFAGVAVHGPDDAALTVTPHVPDRWPELQVALRWHGTPVRLRCRADGVHVACDRAILVDVHGTRAVVEPPGRWVG